MSLPIAYVCADPGIPADGHKGASVHFQRLAAAFARLAVPLDVFLVRGSSVHAFAPHRARVVAAPRGPGLVGELLQFGHAAALFEALQAAGPHAAVYERLSLGGLAGLAHARSLGIPFVVEVNAPLWQEAERFRSLGLPRTARGVCLDVLHAADRVIAVSAPLADELRNAGVPSAILEVIGNGADVAAFATASPAPKPAALRGRPTLLFIGSLKPWHGIPFLLRAFAALRAQRACGLWLVGDGPARDEIAVAARAFPGDIVHDGAIPHDAIPGVLQAADVVVAPYPAAAPPYFSPLKVVEALAAGRPLLASRVPCVLSALAGHAPPGLFAADDVADFVRAALRVLDAGPAAGRLGIDPVAVQALDWTKKAEALLPLLRRPGSPQPLEASRG
jgi:glycosyltransferase involved in cell wall biosynthesis